MDCPVCVLPMDKLKLFGVEIDTCRFCGGLWLDRNELGTFIQKGNIPKRLLTTYCLDDRKKMVKEGERSCPRCGNLLQLVSHRGINVEFCNGCGGLWFDRGELLKIVKSYYDETKKKGKRKKIAGRQVARQEQVDDDDQEMIRITDDGVFEYIESKEYVEKEYGEDEEERESVDYSDESLVDPIMQELMSAGSKEAVAKALPKSAVEDKTSSPMGKPAIGRIPSTMGSPLMKEISPLGFTRRRRRVAGELIFGTISAFIKSFFEASRMSR